MKLNKCNNKILHIKIHPFIIKHNKHKKVSLLPKNNPNNLLNILLSYNNNHFQKKNNRICKIVILKTKAYLLKNNWLTICINKKMNYKILNKEKLNIWLELHSSKKNINNYKNIHLQFNLKIKCLNSN